MRILNLSEPRSLKINLKVHLYSVIYDFLSFRRKEESVPAARLNYPYLSVRKP